MFKFLSICFLFTLVSCDLLGRERSKGATLKPISACCDIPELGDPKPLAECSNPKLPGPCNDIQCVFEKSDFLVDRQTLNKEAYRSHLEKWSANHKGWARAIEKAISDCVDKDLRQYLDYPCRAYDVFTCTSIAMLKVANKPIAFLVESTSINDCNTKGVTHALPISNAIAVPAALVTRFPILPTQRV